MSDGPANWLQDMDIPADIFRPQRMDALRLFNRLGIPSARHEEWRFSSLRSRLKSGVKFVRHSTDSPTSAQGNSIFQGFTIHVHNGLVSKVVGDLPEGIRLYSFEDAALLPDFKSYLTPSANMSDNALWQLNSATFSSGFVLHATGSFGPQSVNIIYSSDATDESSWVQSRGIVVVETKAELNLRECFSHIGAGIWNHAAEFYLKENARLVHALIRDTKNKARLISQQEAHINERALFHTSSFFLNGDYSRNTTQAYLKGSAAHAEINGVYTVSADQLTDNHVMVDHKVADCTSSQLFKGVLDEQSTAVFNGKIFVQPDAQRTKAYQSSKAVLLSEDCIIHSKPQLEIFADDVKCSHGAAIGQLNEHEIFYLRARGIDAETAKSMILNAFVQDVVLAHPDEEVQSFIEEHLAKQFLPTDYVN